jgi:hemoglobin
MEQEASLYETIGGAEKIRALVNEFYHQMDTLPEAQGIRAQHHGDMNLIKEKLCDFLSGWMGGPPLFVEKYGHPRLRARHLPFTIGTSERDQWMLCMDKALHNVGITEPSLTTIHKALYRLADHMRNTEG